MIHFTWRLPILLVALLIAIVTASVVIPLSLNAPTYGLVSFGRGVNLIVELANTPAKQVQGLSGRELLEPRTGMLFPYNDSEPRTFWMKEMRFPIDIIWIDDERVVGFVEDAQPPASPSEAPATFTSPPADNVLEVEAGFVADHQIYIGQKLIIDVDLSDETGEVGFQY